MCDTMTEVVFAVVSSEPTARVHVMGDKPVPSWFGGEMSLGEHLARMNLPTLTLCGLEVRQLPGKGGEVTDFDDERLCVTCYKAFPEDQRHRLFGHPGEEDD